jgi:eukaryotic-like serine/threonine-protein kinase
LALASTNQSGDRICPFCRGEPSAPDGDGDGRPACSISKCPDDGYAYVSKGELAAADGDPFLGATIGDRYVVLGRLGAGSMGMVYRARHLAMGRDVALKILRSDRAFDAQAKARFAREARAMSMLSCPHTVTVFDFGEAEVPRCPGGGDGEMSLYLALELLDGESLGDRLKRRGRLSIREAARICTDAATSLAEAHEKGVIHRDLKPDNLFLVTGDSGDVSCKLLDFGIAKVLRDTAEVDALETQAGTVFGTPRYMSPEQAQGKPLDARSDLYSLGVLLYHMLVGRAPFADEDAVVVMAHHIKSAPLPPAIAAPDAAIPASLSDFVMKCMAKDPARRPGSAPAFISGLEKYLVDNPTAEGVAVSTWRAQPSRAQLAALLVGTAITVGLAGFLALGRPGETPVAGPSAQAGVAAHVARISAAARGASGPVSPAAAPPERVASPATDATASEGPHPSPSASAKPPSSPKAGTKPKYVRFD